MLETAKRLALGVILIALAAGVLLYTDRGARNRSAATAGGGGAPRIRHVALVQHGSIPALEDGGNGVIESLTARGYAGSGKIDLKRFNAEADLGTANTIAKEVTSGGYDLIISVSTPSLQTVANANKSGTHTPHVFGLVSDPYSTGVGIERTNHAIHPPYMTGMGCMQPVASSFRTAREMRLELKSVGLVWNPAEANSQAQTKIARGVCAELGIELVEANAENSTSALEAANSLVSRGVEAIWISGDVTISLATDSIINAARRGRIPVFTVMPPNVKKGSLFDLGANYYEVGLAVGNLAADVLDGKNPADVPVENFAPELFLINETALAGLRDTWSIPPSVRKRASGFITSTSTNLPSFAVPPVRGPKPLARKMNIDLIEYLETPNVEIAREGVLAGFKKAGLERGRDYELRVRNAQGDMATLNTIVDAAISDNSDLLFAAATPALQGALRRGNGRPLVFTLIANPVLAGAGKSDTDHLPFVTGSYIPSPHEEALVALKRCLPNARRIGTLFVPSEVNSVFYKDDLLGAAKKLGYEVELVGVSTSSEISDAALALCGRNIDVFCQISDNLTGGSFASIAQAAKRAKIPLMSFAAGQAKQGAFMTISRDYFDGGVSSAEIAVRVLRGESPAKIPFHLVTHIQYIFNPTAAAQYGIQFPADLLGKGESIH